MKFCGEIQYDKQPEDIPNAYDKNGIRYPYWVHSDICFNCYKTDPNKELSDEYRKFLHGCLDEWLDNSSGTGAFWVGDDKFLKEVFNQSEM